MPKPLSLISCKTMSYNGLDFLGELYLCGINLGR